MKAIQDIRINRISIEKDDDGKESISGSYSLIAPTGAVIAKQSFNDGYSGVKLEPSEKSRSLLIQAVSSFKEDINKIFGFTEE